ncbi:MAG: hypothetical protein SV422_00930, partial [Pseudomonadota bacterium]|nr:hypothetical protein [Pseudomonadota bacterium]
SLIPAGPYLPGMAQPISTATAGQFTFTYTCSNAGGSGTDTVVLTVTEADGATSPPVVNMSLSQTEVNPGVPVTLTITVQGVAGVCQMTPLLTPIPTEPYHAAPRTLTLNTVGNHTYTYSCTNSKGTGSDSKTLTVISAASPTINPGFSNQSNIHPETTLVSNTVTVSGFTGTATAAISGSSGGTPEISVNGGAWTTSNVLVSSGDSIRLKMAAPASLNTATTATLSVNAASFSWSVSTPSQPIQLAAGFDDQYMIFEGDFGSAEFPSDGKTDYFVRRNPAEARYIPGADEFLLLSLSEVSFGVGQVAHYGMVTALTPSELAAVSPWPESLTADVMPGDFDADGVVDLNVSQLYSSTADDANLIVFASELAGGAPEGITQVTPAFTQFFADVGGWLANPNYYAATGSYQVGQPYWDWIGPENVLWRCNNYGGPRGWVPLYMRFNGTESDFEDYQLANAASCVFLGLNYLYWDLMHVLVKKTAVVSGIDWYKFYPDVQVFTGELETILGQGALVAGSPEALTIEAFLTEVLGRPYMGGVLSNPGAVLPDEIDIPPSELPAYRAGKVTSTLNDCEEPAALGMSLTGAACAAGIILEPGPASEVVCLCYYSYKIFTYLRRASILLNEANGQVEVPEIPDDLVGEVDENWNEKPNGVNAGKLSPAAGGTGDPVKDFEKLTGGTGTLDPDTGHVIGGNGIRLRPAGPDGPRIDIPAKGTKKHETLHYPPENTPRD